MTGQLIGVQNRGRVVISVEDFGAQGYPHDDLGAFQRASNFLYLAGGGLLRLGQRKYFLGEYIGADVNSTICGVQCPPQGRSRIWRIPSKVTVEGDINLSELNVLGGTSNALGFETSANVLIYPHDETSSLILAVESNSVITDMPSGLNPGDLVILARPGGKSNGVPRTPSQERSPQQFMHVASADGQHVRFEEDFIHNFEAASDDLRIYKCLEGYPQSIFLRRLIFASSSGAGYFLFSRTYGCGFDEVTFSNHSMSWGTCQGVRNGSLSINVARDMSNTITVESTSDFSISQFNSEGNGSINPLGPLFFSDNCRRIRIDRYYARGFGRTGFAALYSFEGTIDQMELHDCGVTASYDQYAAALTVGYPAEGATPNRETAEAPFNKKRYLGPCKIKIHSLRILGSVAICIRAHDADLQISDAYLEFANNDADTLAPIYVGHSGSRRADPKWWPKGGEIRIEVHRLMITTKKGQPAVYSCKNGYEGLFKAPEALVVTEQRGDARFLQSLGFPDASSSCEIFWINENDSGAKAKRFLASDIHFGKVSFAVLPGPQIPIGTGLWRVSDSPVTGEIVLLHSVMVDGRVWPFR